MKNLTAIFIIAICFTGCLSPKLAENRTPSALIDNNDCMESNICIGQNVIAYYDREKQGRVAYIGRVVDISRSGEIEIDNGAPARYTLKTKEAFKEVKCLDGLCSNTRAVNSSGSEYDIRQIFMNQAVLADQGNPNYGIHTKTSKLFSECQCIGNICKFDTIISPKAKKIRVDGVYKNGIVRSKDDFYANYNVYTLKELGGEGQCTSDSPCECTK